MLAIAKGCDSTLHRFLSQIYIPIGPGDRSATAACGRRQGWDCLRAANGGVNEDVFCASLRDLAAEEGWVSSWSGLVGVLAELTVLKGVHVRIVRVVVPIEPKRCNDSGEDLQKHTVISVPGCSACVCAMINALAWIQTSDCK